MSSETGIEEYEQVCAISAKADEAEEFYMGRARGMVGELVESLFTAIGDRAVCDVSATQAYGFERNIELIRCESYAALLALTAPDFSDLVRLAAMNEIWARHDAVMAPWVKKQADMDR